MSNSFCKWLLAALKLSNSLDFVLIFSCNWLNIVFSSCFNLDISISFLLITSQSCLTLTAVDEICSSLSASLSSTMLFNSFNCRSLSSRKASFNFRTSDWFDVNSSPSFDKRVCLSSSFCFVSSYCDVIFASCCSKLRVVFKRDSSLSSSKLQDDCKLLHNLSFSRHSVSHFSSSSTLEVSNSFLWMKFFSFSEVDR